MSPTTSAPAGIDADAIIPGITWCKPGVLLCGLWRRSRRALTREFMEEQWQASQGMAHLTMIAGLVVFALCALRDLVMAPYLPLGLGPALGWRLGVFLALFALTLAVGRRPTLAQAQPLAAGFIFLLLAGLAFSATASPAHLSHVIFPVVFVCLMITAIWLEGPGLAIALAAGLGPVVVLIHRPGVGVDLISPSASTWEALAYDAFVALSIFLGMLLRHARLHAASETFLFRQHLARMAHTDPLTGALNRAGWEHQLALQATGPCAGAEPSALLYFDLDKFKAINDQLGHPEGDRYLVLAADVARKALRGQDILARFGGEEFVAFLPRTNQDEAMVVAERMRQAMEEAGRPEPLPLTVSVGVAAVPRLTDTPQALDRADRALLAAKQEGRNRVCLALA